ncbi:MAG: tRNA (guanosine(37)-N1)-methyltransferase TrmD [Bdellovibrionales bacterium CG12_big_fil_rev_8_21_14_0_65_38_15]|nr:MAG: tRNA (guanosine(37)-N1)-methyltransferase TrmD [Bdellovibrionales bacterium CG22_combo_CG10-13_8_21_14_all_38_13]PIQ54345.1 MAG: tRNA (guanosine(37)-N1)-methyltransferase TrmD [Bdellovibrionales bacterium CG12_big_fil_rev_8_21_14_0_65_38_15]PIR28300.1 MAG: tRNA (guanosine(37)-N1)-methyltransferase TrmD [Bdellovibrionales bacterium CG11_big_fil_rev_8_21_14_0_20_38_13]
MKRIWIVTLFPDYFDSFLSEGIAGQAFSGKRGEYFDVQVINPRDFALDNHQSVDAYPYGGGAGMVMRPDILETALLEGVVAQGAYDQEQIKEQLTIVCPGPRGTPWKNKVAKDFAVNHLAGEKDLVFICGRYEGIDERFLEKYVDQHFSIGDFILTGGELAVMVMLDSAVRFVPGILGNKESAQTESFQQNLLEEPMYTRPALFGETPVPAILTSGNHAKVDEYRKQERLRMTSKYRPDLLEKKS